MGQSGVRDARDAEALLEGHFLLASGLHSDPYVQCAELLQQPIYADTYWAYSSQDAFGWDVETSPAPTDVARRIAAGLLVIAPLTTVVKRMFIATRDAPPSCPPTRLAAAVNHSASSPAFLASRSGKAFLLSVVFALALSVAVGAGLYYSNLRWIGIHGMAADAMADLLRQSHDESVRMAVGLFLFVTLAGLVASFLLTGLVSGTRWGRGRVPASPRRCRRHS